MSFNVYHWCLVPECKNTSVKTPHKLWIQLPSDIKLRKTWLTLARRDPKSLSTNTRLYFCEDHFDVLMSSCIWASYFQTGLFFGTCPVMIAQLRREARANVTNHYVIDDAAASWISSAGTFSAIPCVFIVSLMGEYLGRKLSYLLICVATFASFIIFYCSTTFNHIILSQILQGPLNGGTLNVLLVIAAECASPKYRGIFLTIKSANVYWGIWVANAVGTFFHWKNIGIIGIACSVYSTLVVAICPESPYWLASKGRIKKCEEAHRWLRGADESAEKELEHLINIEMERSRQTQGHKSCSQLCSIYVKKICARQFYQPILLCIVSVVMFHLNGKLALAVYSIDILRKINDNESVAYTAMLIIDGITVLSMYIGCIVSRYAKRRTMLFSTVVVAIFFLFSLSLYLYLIRADSVNENVYLSIALLLAFSLSIGCGPMILVTSLISEILPLDLRTFAAIIVCVVNKSVLAITLKLTPMVLLMFGVHVVFLIFAVTSLVCVIILMKYLPETKNKTIHEIEDLFKMKKGLEQAKELVPLTAPISPAGSRV